MEDDDKFPVVSELWEEILSLLLSVKWLDIGLDETKKWEGRPP